MATDQLLEVWEDENARTLRVLRAVPEGRMDLRAGKKGWRMGDLCWHIVTAERWFCTSAVGLKVSGPDPVPKERPPATVAAMADARVKSHRRLAAAVKRRGDRWLAATIDLYGLKRTRGQVLDLMLKHEAHHRGQLSVYLRLAGAKVPSIYGPSADDPGK